ncbi:MAG: hypothetical protein DWH91_14060 [Planctomycetota bacterium]|nr:MAG: hypothetical protein DWH91_14060 [Planctomycetota bacterium]
MHKNDPPRPLNEPHCPLCGQRNECAVVACGSLAAPCWCRSLVISGEILAQVPEDRRGKACLCQECVNRGNAGPGGEPVLD